MAQAYSIALLGQPNSGKSTLFNGLTGSHQRVGNWPGKTVEKKIGTFERDGITYTVCDLPGAYSLSAMSEEERITQDYIAAGEADVVLVMVDASQLTRSMYMLADYAGGRVPCVVALNMMDVAEGQGKRIDAALLESRLGIPVVPFVANDARRYDELLAALRRAADNNLVVSSDVLARVYAEQSPQWQETYDRLAPTVAADARFDAVWQAAHEASAEHDGAVTCGSARLIWVDQLLAGVQGEVADKAPAFLTRLDNALMSPKWGQLVGILVCLGALFGSASGTLFATVSGAASAGFSPAVIASQVSAAEALAFLSALMFNIPCVMVVGATHSETHSAKWTAIISVFYFLLALCISCVVYHVAALVL